MGAVFGDVDLDGDIDADDIDRLYMEFGTSASWKPADLDRDDMLDEQDAQIWVQQVVGTDFADADLN